MESNSPKTEIDPSAYGLKSTIRLKKLSNNRIAIVKVIKSRIVQKDAVKIIALANQLKSVTPELEVTLLCTRNICSKSIQLLHNNDVSIEFVN